MDNLIAIILATISGILLIYNFILGRKLKKERDEEIKEVEQEIKESKNEATKLTNELTDLIKLYRKSRGNESDSD